MDENVIEMPLPLGIYAKHLYERAVEYTDALRILARETDAPGRPAAFLFAHALEVALKSFLAARGVTRKEIEKHLRHDLNRIMERAEALGLPDVYMLKSFAGHMHEMNQDYDLRYPTGYNLHLPPARDCLPIAEALLGSISSIVEHASVDASLQFASDTRHMKGKRIVFSN